ncbi:DUF6542 domain-containing protein [Rhodococcus sp. IEGM 1379]|uniref:DUF6542 domain-containing protein n=1 Tax=Rhodococcus sp. IEGM 1379 TaxID=3047086 RepID=UPI0024B64543|nr:DUF6542 domain-containing protein [Rhodococcus sp. IEGM 1379]MDI9918563.1 hypothetical protein [Rhodococcus sp. IEGM 1379]
MSATQRARSGVPLDKRSLIVTVPGLPWWGVILLAAGLTSVGVLIDASGGGGELTSAFSTFYFLGCVFAVIAAANNSLFTAMAQPPLLMFVSVPVAQTLIGKDNSTALRDIAINVALPLVNRFPVMLGATVVVLAIGGFRYFLLHQRPTRAIRSTRSRRTESPSPTSRTSAAAASASVPEPAPDSQQRRRRNAEQNRPPVAATDATPQPRRRSVDHAPHSGLSERPSQRPPVPRDSEYNYRPLPRRNSAPADARYQPPNHAQPHAQPVAERREYPSYGERRVPEGRVPEGSVPEGSVPEGRVPDSRVPDAGQRRSEERMDPFFASGDSDLPLPPRRRPVGADLPAYPAPRVRYRDRDETPN